MRVRSLIGLAALLLATSCASAGPPLDAEITRVPSRRVEVWSVHAEDAGDVVRVRGLVRRRPLDNGPLWGHVDVEARFGDGRLPIVTEAFWSAPSAKSSRTAPYSARLPIADAAAVTDIVVSYAPGRHADEANPGSSS